MTTTNFFIIIHLLKLINNFHQYRCNPSIWDYIKANKIPKMNISHNILKILYIIDVFRIYGER